MSAPTSTPELLLAPGRANRQYWRDVWRYRELLGFLAWRDIKVRYKQAVLGILWVVIQPAVQTVLLTFVFGKLAGMPSGEVPYVTLVFSGQVAWLLFASAFNGVGASLVTNSHLVSKIYFPRLVAPLAACALALVDTVVLLAVALPFAPLLDLEPTWRWLLLPGFMALALAVAFGAGLWICALNVKYRDFRFITPFLLQIGMFVTPVGFSLDFLPNWRGLLALNPLTGVVEGFRWSLLGPRTDFSWESFGVAVGLAALLLASGLWFFRRTEREFADII
jgi:lipopolysaccharide transport system permease protein